MLIFENSKVSRRGKTVIFAWLYFPACLPCRFVPLTCPLLLSSPPFSPLSPFLSIQTGNKEKRKRDRVRNRGGRKRMQPEPPLRPHHLSIIQSPSPDLCFAHRHFRWEASTATYTPDQATRRGSGARRPERRRRR